MQDLPGRAPQGVEESEDSMKNRIRLGIGMDLGEYDGIAVHSHRGMKEVKDFETLEEALAFFEKLRQAIVEALKR